MDKKWQHKDEWKVLGDGFCIVVSRHDFGVLDSTRGDNNWCVYVYIYPKHPYFKEVQKDENMSGDAANAMPLHGGCTLFKSHRDENGEVCSYQIGADYNHLYDENFTHMKTPSEAFEVFSDAETLFQWMERKNG